MLNNLLIIKNFPKKNTKKFELLVDEIILKYQSDKNDNIKNIYNMPSGIKGMIYYKINEVYNKNINFCNNISKKAVLSLNKINSDYYYPTSKILGIIFDNAIEASIESKNPEIVLDIYEKENYIYISLYNTYKGKINIEDINNKNFSTKGKNRGLGLFIVNSITRKNKNIKLNQKCRENYFETIIEIKK